MFLERWLFEKRILKISLFFSISWLFSNFAYPYPALADSHRSSDAPTDFSTDVRTSLSRVVIMHQGMLSHLEFSLEYGLNDYGDDIEKYDLMRDVVNLLSDYPDEYDYWEIVNLSITRKLLEKYTQLEYITLNLHVLPRASIPYHCVSTVTHWANGDIQEAWRFEAQDIFVQGKAVDTSISYTYQHGAVYPDFLDIYAQLSNYLNTPLQPQLTLDQLAEIAEQQLLENHSEELSSIAIELQ